MGGELYEPGQDPEADEEIRGLASRIVHGVFDAIDRVSQYGRPPFGVNPHLYEYHADMAKFEHEAGDPDNVERFIEQITEEPDENGDDWRLG